jgi:hypothetical protein
MPGDGSTFEDPQVRQAFVRAALLASDVWGGRVFGDHFEITGTLNDTRLRVLPTLRQAHIDASPGQHPFLTLARGVTFFGDYIQRALPEANSIMREQTGLGLDEYYSVLTCLAVLGLGKSAKEDLLNPDKCGLLNLGTLRKDSDLFDLYFQKETLSPEDLRACLWGARQDADEKDAGPFDLKALREKPILRVAGERGIILDPKLFVERATAGPLFYMVGARPQEANRWFAAFGQACEGYVHQMLDRMFPAIPCLARRYVRNPVGHNDGIQNELADAIVVDDQVAGLFEIKAVWLRDDITSTETDPAEYLRHLRTRYGISDRNQPGERRVKGVGQLARTITRLSQPGWLMPEIDMGRVRRILPILVVHDPHLDAAIHPYALAQEFINAVRPDEPVHGWREMQKGGLQVAHLIVMTVDDLEMLETSIENFSLLECLQAYAAEVPDRLVSFYNFLVTSRFKSRLRSNDWLIKKRDELFQRSVDLVFHGKDGDL